jgi:hypothetical protein
VKQCDENAARERLFIIKIEKIASLQAMRSHLIELERQPNGALNKYWMVGIIRLD